MSIARMRLVHNYDLEGSNVFKYVAYIIQGVVVLLWMSGFLFFYVIE